MNIIIKFKNDIIANWITKKLNEYFKDRITITNETNLATIDFNKNFLITENIFFNEINNEHYDNCIIISTDLFFLDKHKLDISILYTPINLQNLISIIENKEENIHNIYKFKDFQANIDNNLLSITNTITKIKITFTQNESIVLRELIHNYNQPVLQQDLLSIIWNIKDKSKDIQSNTIETHINSIRKKFKINNFDLQIKKHQQSYLII